MSTLKVTNLQHASSGSASITLDSGGTASFNGKDVSGIASINGGQLGGANLVQNGAMTVAQRGSSFTGVTSTAYHLDRFQTELTTLGTWTVTQEADGPDGFAYSLKYACTTADASPASGDTFRMVYKFEGQDLQHLQKGTANAKDCTLSFWVKSNKTGTGQFNVRDIDNNRGINKTYTIDAADTWEYKTITIQGDTTGTISNDNGSSFWLMWVFNSGTGNSSGTFNSDWHSFDFTDINASGTLAIGGSTSDYIQITGIQLEVGSQATVFQHENVGTTLQKCYRYFQRFGGDGNFDVSSTSGFGINSNTLAAITNLRTDMRAQPTLSINSIESSDVINSAVSITSASLSTAITSTQIAYVQYTSSGTGIVAYRPYYIRSDNTSAGYVDFDAEL